VEAGKYGGAVQVKWIPGKKPTLVLYDDNNREVQREEVSRFTYGELSEKLAGYGFRKIGDPALVKSSPPPPKAAVDQEFSADEFFDPEPTAPAATKLPWHSTLPSRSKQTNLFLPSFVSTTGVSRPVGRRIIAREHLSQPLDHHNLRGGSGGFRLHSADVHNPARDSSRLTNSDEDGLR